MKNRLKKRILALSSGGDRDFRMHLKVKVGKRAEQLLNDRLRFIIASMPVMIQDLHQHWDSRKLDPDSKRLSGLLFAYVETASDLVSEESFGLFGLLDDAYLVSTLYMAGPGQYKNDDFHTKISSGIKAIQTVLPGETDDLDKMVLQIQKEGDWTTLGQALGLAKFSLA